MNLLRGFFFFPFNVIKQFIKYAEYRKVIFHLDTRYAPYKENTSTFWGVAHLSRYAYIIKNLIEKEAESKKWVVFDAGCGTGYGVSMISEHCAKVDGMDISEEAIKYANRYYKRENTNYYVGDITEIKSFERLPLTYDLILSFDVLEHLRSPSVFMENISKRLKNGGKVVLGTPNRLMVEKYKTYNHYHIKEYSPDELSALLLSSFKKVKILGQNIAEPVFKKIFDATGKDKTGLKIRLVSNLKRLMRALFSMFGLKHPFFLCNEILAVEDVCFSDVKLENAFGLVAIAEKGT